MELATLIVADAASRLGISVQAIYSAITRGELDRVDCPGEMRVTEVSISRLQQQRRSEALARQRDVPALAAELRALVWPAPEPARLTVDGRRVDDGKPYHPPAPRTRAEAREALAISLRARPDAVAIFGPAALAALTIPEGTPGGCRWCWTALDARALGGVAPEKTASWRALFGTAPCADDEKRWAAERLLARGRAQEEREAQLRLAKERSERRVQRRHDELRAAQAEAHQYALVDQLRKELELAEALGQRTQADRLRRELATKTMALESRPW